MTETTAAPAVTGFHHFPPAVSDVEASAQWSGRVFGMNRVPVTFPRYGAGEGGYAVLLIDSRSGIAVGLDHHGANPGQPFDESRAGLDHISSGVADRAGLDAWASGLGELGVGLNFWRAAEGREANAGGGWCVRGGPLGPGAGGPKARERAAECRCRGGGPSPMLRARGAMRWV